jgi:hypothetical protein
MLVDHHVDPRIQQLDISHREPVFKAGYFGELVSTVQTPGIAKLVDFHLVDTSKQVTDWFNEIGDYTFHYAIRQAFSDYRLKPFLKGFNAAHLEANILIQESEEAVRWLGTDYPYLLKGAMTESSILKALRHAQASFGKADWQRGLAIMAKIKKATTDKKIADQLVKLF